MPEKLPFLKFCTNARIISRLNISKPIIPSQKGRVLYKNSFIRFFNKANDFYPFLLKKESWWLVKKIAYRCACSAKQVNNNLLLEDSGILQPFLSFEIEENLSNIIVPIDCLLKYCQLPDIVLNFNISPAIAMTRYERRGLRGEGQTIQKIVRSISRASELQKELYHIASKRKFISDVDSQHEFTDRYKTKFNEINALLTEKKKYETFMKHGNAFLNKPKSAGRMQLFMQLRLGFKTYAPMHLLIEKD